MASIKITVDGIVQMNGEPGQWTDNPPELFNPTKLRARSSQEPWLLALLPEFAKALMTSTSLTADVRTRPDGYDLSVTK
jgi:hypothetical protein